MPLVVGTDQEMLGPPVCRLPIEEQGNQISLAFGESVRIVEGDIHRTVTARFLISRELPSHREPHGDTRIKSAPSRNE